MVSESLSTFRMWFCVASPLLGVEGRAGGEHWEVKSVAPKVFGTRGQFHKRQFFHWGWGGDGLGMIQVCDIYCVRYFCYYIVIYNDIQWNNHTAHHNAESVEALSLFSSNLMVMGFSDTPSVMCSCEKLMLPLIWQKVELRRWYEWWVVAVNTDEASLSAALLLLCSLVYNRSWTSIGLYPRG